MSTLTAPHSSAPVRARLTDPASEPIPASVWRIAIVIVLGAFMANLDTSLVNVGLDTIGRNLHGSLSSVQWVTTGYLVALAGALPICAWLGRRIGPGRLWRLALAGFTVTSGLCAIAPSLGALIAFRVLQGIAGGLLVPSGQIVLGRAAGPARLGRVMNTVGIAVVLGPALGPTVGGLLIDHLSWHWLFLVNLPVGVIAWVAGKRFVPAGERDASAAFDWRGAVLVIAGLPALTYGIVAASQHRSLSGAATLIALAVGIAGLAGFVVHALRRPRGEALLDLRLFGNRTFRAAEVTVLFTGASLFGGMIVLPLYFELLRGESVIDAGLLMLSYGAGTALMLRLSGGITDRLGGGITATAGLLITVVTTLPFAFLSARVSMPAVEALQFGRGIGLGLSGLPAMTAAFRSVTPEQLPDATAQSNILQRVAGSLGSALFVVILQDGGAGIGAFHRTYLWLAITAAAAMSAAIWLAIRERSDR